MILNAVAVELAHPDPASVVAGEDVDPVTTAVVSSFGSWSSKPFAAIVLVAFLACGMAAQSVTARTMYSVARDGAVPGSRFLRRVDRRKVPIGAVVVTTVVACLGLLLGLDANAVGNPDRVRHGGDLRLVPADRAGGADRARARHVEARRARAARSRGAGRSTWPRWRGSRSRP